MRLKGNVDVYEIVDGKAELIHSEHNLIVDGAGESIATMLTTASSADSDTNVFDTSNFVVQAVSFGKASATFATPYLGAHIYSNELSAEYSTETYLKALHSVPNITASAVDDPSGLPQFPSPRNTGLEASSRTMYELSIGDLGFSNGHCLNRLRVNVNPSSLFQGCYAPSGGIDLYIVSGDLGAASVVTFSAIVSGHYNRLNTMDNSGHIRCHFSQDAQDETQACIVSGSGPNTTGNVNASATFILNPAVNYTLTLSGADKQMLNAYGGIQHIGLWTLNVKDSLALGAAPFSFITDENTGDSLRIYRLFAKKTFAENLARCTTTTFTGFTDLFIQWKISFDYSTGNWA